MGDKSFDFIFSYASLYHIPRVKNVVNEIARVLYPGGFAAIELGNLYSINTFAASALHIFKGLARPYHISYSKMLCYVK
ncbi:class I SAM-dependent methyltransferase, partial [bacterium]|nr:class I SAM-dependent methyltransferase [bacterium]